MTTKAERLASRIDPVILIDPSTRRIYIQLESVFGSIGLSQSLMPELVCGWREEIKTVAAEERGESGHLYLPLRMLPEFIDGVPTGLIPQEGQNVADEYKRLVKSMQFSSLLISHIRQLGLNISMDKLPEGISEKDVQDVAAFIAEQPSRRCSGYQPSITNSRVSFNGRKVC